MVGFGLRLTIEIPPIVLLTVSLGILKILMVTLEVKHLPMQYQVTGGIVLYYPIVLLLALRVILTHMKIQ